MSSNLFEGIPTGSLKAIVSAITSTSMCSDVVILKAAPSLSKTQCDGILQLLECVWQAGQIALMIEQVVRARCSGDQLSHLIELVISGPQVANVYPRTTQSVFSEMVSIAEEEIVLVSYAIYNGSSIFKPVVECWAERPSMDVKLYLDIPRKYKDKTQNSRLIAQYRKSFVEKEWPSERLPDLFYFKASLEEDPVERASMYAKVVSSTESLFSLHPLTSLTPLKKRI